VTPEQLAGLAELERQARQRGHDFDPRGAYVFDPDAEHDEEVVDDLAGGLTEAERTQLRQLEAKYVARFTERCSVCSLPLAAGQRGRHHCCASTCADCYRPATNCQCSATVRRKRQAATA
jgi:hypothetical protein